MKRIIVWISAILAILLVFGSVFSIDFDKLKGKDSDEPAKTTRPSTTTVPEAPAREPIESLATLLESFEFVNRSSAVDGVVGFENSTLIAPTEAIDCGEDGNEFNVLTSSNEAFRVYETGYSYGNELVISFHYRGFDDTFNLPLMSYRIGTSTIKNGSEIRDTYRLLSFMGNTCYATPSNVVLTQGYSHTVSMHVNLSEGYVDYYVGDVFVRTIPIPYYSTATIISAFDLYFESRSYSTAFQNISVSVYAPKSVTN